MCDFPVRLSVRHTENHTSVIFVYLSVRNTDDHLCDLQYICNEPDIVLKAQGSNGLHAGPESASGSPGCSRQRSRRTSELARSAESVGTGRGEGSAAQLSRRRGAMTMIVPILQLYLRMRAAGDASTDQYV